MVESSVVTWILCPLTYLGFSVWYFLDFIVAVFLQLLNFPLYVIVYLCSQQKQWAPLIKYVRTSSWAVCNLHCIVSVWLCPSYFENAAPFPFDHACHVKSNWKKRKKKKKNLPCIVPSLSSSFSSSLFLQAMFSYVKAVVEEWTMFVQAHTLMNSQIPNGPDLSFSLLFSCVQWDGCINKILSPVGAAYSVGCQEQIFCRPPELGFEGYTCGPCLLPCLIVERAGLQKMLQCLVRFSTGALAWGLYANFLDGWSVCNGLFWGERQWCFGVLAADDMSLGLGRWLSFYYRWELWPVCKTYDWRGGGGGGGGAPFSFLLLQADLLKLVPSSAHTKSCSPTLPP